ncbi:MAG: Phosphinothricin acetyltransferase [Thermoleophilia bacterium]|nr:Phosphinothricin acetyltransferase [Thermoleophilia bacterium]
MIRPARPDDDAEAVARIHAPYVTDTAVSFEEDAPDAAEMARRITGAIRWLVCERDGAVVGYAYAGAFHGRAAYRWSVELSVYVDGSARRSGVGGELLDELLRELREGGYVQAFAGATLPNPGSVGLFGSRGFRRVATFEAVGHKLGAWHDVAWMQLALREPTSPPPPLSAGPVGG